MAQLLDLLTPESPYWDKKTCSSKTQWLAKLKSSTTVYVGNLSFYTTEDQLYELFDHCGPIKQLVMGLNKLKKVPCGFAFIQFETREAATTAVECLNYASCDDRVIRVDLDTGEGIESTTRKYGRSFMGGQWRDVFRQGYEEGRDEGGSVDYDDWVAKTKEVFYSNRRKRQIFDDDGPFPPRHHPSVMEPYTAAVPAGYHTSSVYPSIRSNRYPTKQKFVYNIDNRRDSRRY